MKRMSLFISADSGPIHIAHALEIPLIDIIGPVDPDEQAPDNEMSIIIKPPHNIKPTVFALLPQGDPQESRRAIESISVDAVYEAFEILREKIKKTVPV
jgi:ADP-heptose:LPS heptosyltransferase